MPYTSQTSDFWGWYLRHNSRTIWKHFSDAGIDVFASGPSNNTQAFLDLMNVLPSINGGLNRRWGVTQYFTLTTGAFTSDSAVRQISYVYPQDVSNPSNTLNRSVWFFTDNQNWWWSNDAGAAPTSPFYGPANAASSGEMTAAQSRGFLYYGNGTASMRKVNPSYTGSNTDSLCGISLPVNTSTPPPTASYTVYPTLQNYPSVWQIAGIGNPVFVSASQGVVGLTVSTAGSGQTDGTYLVAGVGGGGSGAQVQMVISGGTISGPNKIVSAGLGYTSAPTFTAAAGGTPTVLDGILGDASPAYFYSGQRYQSGDTVTITDPTGSGSGAAATLVLDSAGRITGVTITAGGTNYQIANATINTTFGYGGSIVLYVQASLSTGKGPVVGWDLGGPMSFAGGRQYVVALQNSVTGHTSDYYAYGPVIGPTSSPGLDSLTGLTEATPIVGSTNSTAGFTGYGLEISVPATGLDPQVDTVLLLAGADGQGVSTVYEVATIPLSNFIKYPSSGTTLFYQLQYFDTLPDTYNDQNTTGPTLLAANIWSQEDSLGDINGIALNEAPPANLKYFTVHQGRMFATDGRTLFYSKSLDEVTTSTGLITSKWEEAWPGDYQLPLALENEEILGIRSDGTNLHVGTTQNMFTVYGSDPTNFDVPSVQFQQTGLLYNDLWSVVYAEGQPSGFVWVTQDYKIIHSDFSVYREIGTPIYPILQAVDTTKLNYSKLLSLTYGPFNIVLLHFPTTYYGSSQWVDLIWDSRLGKWYRWLPYLVNNGASTSFVYQVPEWTASSFTPGSKFLFYTEFVSGVPHGTFYVSYYNPSASIDPSSTAIPWYVQTSWQDLNDPTALKVLNEVEVMGSGVSSYNVTAFYANNEMQLENQVNNYTVTSQSPPIVSQGSQKAYFAGKPVSSFRYLSIGIGPTTPGGSGTNSNVLTAFSCESYPMARI